MKICLYCRYFYPHIGGNETQTMRLALQLKEQGCDVIVVTAHVDKCSLREEMYKGFKIYRIKYYSLYRLFIFIKKIFNKESKNKIYFEKDKSSNIISIKRNIYLKIADLSHIIEEYTFMWSTLKVLSRHKDEFDIIHSQMLLNYGYMALKAGEKLKKPVIIKDASLGGLNKVNLVPFICKKQNLLKEKGYFIAISSMIADNFRIQGISKNKIFTIPNGIDFSNRNLEVRRNIDPLTILYVGNYWQGEIKGLDVMITAFKVVFNSFPNARLRIAGKGNSEYFFNMASVLGCENNIDFLGQVSEMESLYLSSELFVLPSRQEGMSNAVLEAMSYGMPCVVTDVSGSRDQIEDKVEGLIVPCEDYKLLAEAIIYLLNNPIVAHSMGLKAKEKIRNKFDIKYVTKQLIEVYEQLIINNKN